MLHASLPENGVVGLVCGRTALGRSQFSNGLAVFTDSILVDAQLPAAIVVFCVAVGNPVFSFNRLNVVPAIRNSVQRCHADFIFRRVAYCIIILRIVFRNFGNGGISAIARLRAVRTAVCAAVRRSRCGILTLGRLCLGRRRSGISGSFSGVCFNGSGLCYGTVFVHERQSFNVLIVGQRPARAHGQHHDSRKSSCEQTFARILF